LSAQALSQVDDYLRRMGVVKESVYDTAGAAKTVAENKLM
jgi:prephenate dehydratase